MEKKYTRGQLNQLILKKKLNELYSAIIESKEDSLLSDNDFNYMMKKNIEMDEHSKELYEDAMKTSKQMLGVVDADGERSLMHLLFSFASVIRYFGILTEIDGEIFDINKFESFNPEGWKIVKYNPVSMYYSDDEARLQIASPEQYEQLQDYQAGLDVDDPEPLRKYKEAYLHQDYVDDLTQEFMDEIKGPQRKREELK